MKRTAMPARRTPLRAAPLAGAASERPRKRIKSTGMDKCPAKVRKALLARCEGLCEICGVGHEGVFDACHRKRRSQGGQWTAANTYAAHRLCHNAADEGGTESYGRGWMVASTVDPRLVRFRHAVAGYVFLLDSGELCYNPAAARAAVAGSDRQASA